MKLFAISAGVAAVALSACNPTVGGAPSYSTISSPPPFDFSGLPANQLSSGGYGSGSTNVLAASPTADPDTYRTNATAVAVATGGTFTSSIEGVNLSWWNAPTQLRLDYKGESIILTDVGGLRFRGTSPNFPNGISILFRDSVSASGGAKAIIYELSGVASGTSFANGSGDSSLLLFGASTNPGAMPSSGSAFYDQGAGTVQNAHFSVIHQNPGGNIGYASATGSATLTANFSPAGGTVSGSINNVTSTSSGPYDLSPSTTFSISGTISGNGFSGSVTPNSAANIGMASTSSNSLNGNFFGGVSGGAPTNVGGYFTIGGTSAINAGQSALLFGSFAGE